MPTLLLLAASVVAFTGPLGLTEPGRGRPALVVFGQRNWVIGRRCAVRVLVRDEGSGQPIPGVTVTGSLRLRGKPPHDLFHVTTDETGSAPLSFDAPATDPGQALFTVTALSGQTLLRAKASVILKSERRLSLITGRSVCRAGTAVAVHVLLVVPSPDTTSPSVPGWLRLEDGTGPVRLQRRVRVVPNQVTTVRLPVPEETSPGEYRVAVTAAGLTATAGLEVQSRSLPDTRVELQLLTAPCSPGREARMRVLAFSAAGDPEAGREVRIRVSAGGDVERTLIRLHGTTGDEGRVRFVFRLPELVGITGPLVFTAAVKDTGGRWRTVVRQAPVERAIDSSRGKTKPPASFSEAVVVSVDSPVKTVGDTLGLRLRLSPRQRGVPTAVDLFCSGRYVAAMTVQPKDGLVRASVKLDAELRGLLRVVAYPLVLPKRRCVVGDAFVWVHPSGSAPSVGHGLTGCLRLPDSLPCARNASWERELRRVRQLLFNVVSNASAASDDLASLLARLPRPAPFDLVLDTGYSARRRYHQQGVQKLRRARFEVVYALQEFYNRTGTLPPPTNALPTLFGAKVLKPENAVDPWGRELVLAPVHDTLADFELRSLGEDGKPGTPDDLVIRCDAFDDEVAIDPAPLPSVPPWRFISSPGRNELSLEAARLVRQMMAGERSLAGVDAVRSLWGAENVEAGPFSGAPPGVVGECSTFQWKLVPGGSALTVTPHRRASGWVSQ